MAGTRAMLGWAVVSFTLGGCRSRAVVWDQVGGGDSFEDAAIAFLLFGLTESDPELMDQPFVAGGSLTVHAAPVHGGGSRDWTATTLAEDIASVVAVSPGSPGIEIELAFHQPGTTDLFVFDADGTVLAAQPIRVREPAVLELLAWDDLVLHDAEPLAQPIHLARGTDVTTAVSWRDAAGTPLTGGELVTVEPGLAGVETESWFTGETDVIRFAVDGGADPARIDVGVAAPTVAFDVGVQVRDRSDATHLEVVHQVDAPPAGDDDDDDDAPVTGRAAVRVWAGEDRLVGAPVVFDFAEAGDPLPVGTLVEWSTEHGGPTPVTACFDAVCTTFEVQGVPTAVLGSEAPRGCGCGGPGTGAGGAAIGAALVALARRRRRGGTA